MGSLFNQIDIKRLLLILLIIIFIVIAILSFYFIFKTETRKKQLKSNVIFVEYVKKDAQSRIKDQKQIKFIEDQLVIIQSSSLKTTTRYDSLVRIEEIYSNEYRLTNNPSTRQVINNILGSYAKENFPKLYNESLFNTPCADPTCGNPIPSDISNVIRIIENDEQIPNIAKETIRLNLKNASYLPDKTEGLFGLKLSLSQINRFNDPEASAAAKILSNYIKNNSKTQKNNKK